MPQLTARGLCNPLFALLLIAATRTRAQAQPTPAFPNPPITLDGKGVTINGGDGVTKLNLRFRAQELLAATSESESDLHVKRTQFAVRRMRLRLEGTLRDPRLRINVQLAFARGDLDQENTNFANVLRDANVTWQFTPSLAGSIGQGKLPGLREQLVSSAELQSADRSPVNAFFTVDRDVGVFAAYARNLGRARAVLRGAVTTGEGRNPQAGDGGLAVTARAELLPFGAFTNGGDYIEGDLAREPKVKLSLAGAVSHNDRAIRTGGQLGPLLYAPRGMTTWFLDAMLKRSGVMAALEYARRESAEPLTRSGTLTRYVFAGSGVNAQLSWLLPERMWQLQSRLSIVTPALAIRGQAGAERLEERAVGLARYVNGHRIKMNSELIHSRYRDFAANRRHGDRTLRFAAEIGI